jgi:hypothetical protein
MRSFFVCVGLCLRYLCSLYLMAPFYVLVVCSGWKVVAFVSLGFVMVSQLVAMEMLVSLWFASVCWLNYDFGDW